MKRRKMKLTKAEAGLVELYRRMREETRYDPDEDFHAYALVFARVFQVAAGQWTGDGGMLYKTGSRSSVRTTVERGTPDVAKLALAEALAAAFDDAAKQSREVMAELQEDGGVALVESGDKARAVGGSGDAVKVMDEAEAVLRAQAEAEQAEVH